MSKLPISHAPPPKEGPKSRDLRGYLIENEDIVTHVTKSVSIDHIGALSAQSEGPIVFERIEEYPDFRMCDILVKHRWSQCRALGVPEKDYLRTLAYRLRQPPRGFVNVETGPVKEVILTGNEVDWTQLPVPIHSPEEEDPYITAMNIVRDPETGFYNSSHAGTSPLKPRSGLMSFATPHTHIVMNKYRAMGHDEMPIALVFGLHPAYEIMANYSGLHMDVWGELEMVGTVMAQDVEMVPCEQIDLTVPAHAEIIVEGVVNIRKLYDYGVVVSPTGYYLPRTQHLPEVHVEAITMRADRPIYRNHQTCPFTDHQVLPRLCHEAMLYNRISEIGIPCIRCSVSQLGRRPVLRHPGWRTTHQGRNQRRVDGDHGRALAEHENGRSRQRGYRRFKRGGRLPCNCHPGGPGSGPFRRRQYTRFALRPVGDAERSTGHVQKRRQDRYRRHAQVTPRSERFQQKLAKALGRSGSEGFSLVLHQTGNAVSG